MEIPRLRVGLKYSESHRSRHLEALAVGPCQHRIRLPVADEHFLARVQTESAADLIRCLVQRQRIAFEMRLHRLQRFRGGLVVAENRLGLVETLRLAKSIADVAA